MSEIPCDMCVSDLNGQVCREDRAREGKLLERRDRNPADVVSFLLFLPSVSD